MLVTARYTGLIFRQDNREKYERVEQIFFVLLQLKIVHWSRRHYALLESLKHVECFHIFLLLFQIIALVTRVGPLSIVVKFESWGKWYLISVTKPLHDSQPPLLLEQYQI